MKFKAAILGFLIVLGIVLSFEDSCLGGEKKGFKIGVVSVRGIFESCQRSDKYKKETIERRRKMEAELEKLSMEIEADKAGLATLKQDSDDYSMQVRQIMLKQAQVQAQKEFYERNMVVKEQRMIEKLYADVLKAVSEVAQAKELDMVFEKSEPEFPATNGNDLTLTISTHKLLYSKGCIDITSEVIASIDKVK